MVTDPNSLLQESSKQDEQQALAPPKEAEVTRHRALWEKQIKDTEKQIDALEKGKEERGFYSWAVGSDAVDDKALVEAKSHLEELQKAEKNLKETKDLNKSKSEFKRLSGERGEVLDKTAENYQEVADQAEVGGKVAEGVRNAAVFTAAITTGGAAAGAVTAGAAGYGVIASGVAGIGAGVVTGAATSGTVGAVTRGVKEKVSVNIGLKTEDQAYEDFKTGVGEDIKSGAIAGASSFAGIKAAGHVGLKLGARAESAFGSKVIGATAGGAGGVVGSGLGTADALLHATKEFNETFQGSESERQSAYGEFMSERGLDAVGILKSLGQGALSSALGGAIGGRGSFARENMTSRVARGATMGAQALGAGGAGLAVAGLDGEVTVDEIIEEVSFALFGDVIGEMGVRHVRAQGQNGKVEPGNNNHSGEVEMEGVAHKQTRGLEAKTPRSPESRVSNSLEIKKLETFSVTAENAEGLIARLESEQPSDGTYLYRGVKGEWQKPELSIGEHRSLQNEWDSNLARLEEGAKFTDQEKLRYRELYQTLFKSGDKDQHFSDTLNDDLNYARDEQTGEFNGTIVRVRVDTFEAYQHTLAAGMLPGRGYGTTVRIPRESFLSEPKILNRIDGTDVGGIANVHPEFRSFVERAKAEGFEVRLDEEMGSSAHCDVVNNEIVLGPEASWATLQHESAHLDLHRSIEQHAGGDLVGTAQARRYSEINSLDSSDPLLANALRLVKGGDLSERAAHESVAVMEELRVMREAGISETDPRYEQTLDYGLAHWEVELSRIPKEERTANQQNSLDLSIDSRKKLGLNDVERGKNDERVRESEKEDGVYHSGAVGVGEQSFSSKMLTRVGAERLIRDARKSLSGIHSIVEYYEAQAEIGKIELVAGLGDPAIKNFDKEQQSTSQIPDPSVRALSQLALAESQYAYGFKADAIATVALAKESAQKEESANSKYSKLVSVGKTEFKFGLGNQAKETFFEAREGLSSSKIFSNVPGAIVANFYALVSVAEVACGFHDQARESAMTLNSAAQLNMMLILAKEQKAAGLSDEVRKTFEPAENSIWHFEEDGRIISLAKFGEQQGAEGFIQEAKKTFERARELAMELSESQESILAEIDEIEVRVVKASEDIHTRESALEIADPVERGEALIEVAKSKVSEGLNEEAREVFIEAEKCLRKIQETYDKENLKWILTKEELEAGFIDLGKAHVNELTGTMERGYALLDVVKAELAAGAINEAKETTRNIDDAKNRIIAQLAIAEKLLESSTVRGESDALSRSEVESLLANSNIREIQALGFLRPDLVTKVDELNCSEHKKLALRLGRAEALGDAGKAEFRALAKEAGDIGSKRVLSLALENAEYNVAADILLREYRSEEHSNESLRELRGLIEIRNPKGLTLATERYIADDSSPREREYLARKLIEVGHWDRRLGGYLAGKPKVEVDAVLCALIGDLKITPDLEMFKLLEKPGLLKAPTLEGRVSELREFKSRLNNSDYESVYREVLENPSTAKLYHLVKAGEQKYELINSYRYSRTRKLLKNIKKSKIDEGKLDTFRESLASAGKSEAEAKAIVDEFLAGRVPLEEGGNVVKFSSAVSFGSTREQALGRLQDVWSRELQSLCVAFDKGQDPANMTESLRLLDEKIEISGDLAKLVKRLGLDKKHDEKSLGEVAKDFRNELLSQAKAAGDKRLVAQVRELSDADVIISVLSKRFKERSGNPAFAEWQSHLRETLDDLRNAPKEAEQSVTNRDFELTFLNKHKDIIRVLRFADAQRCCFNSDEGDSMGASKWIAKLNADPLSFLIDIKEEGTDNISGFVFGRMGINPSSGRPVLMLNGIYSQHKAETFNDNVLRIIEEKFARRIGADEIVVASQYGGALSSVPEGYRGVTGRELEAVRALKGRNEVYDDIGTVANGKFKFSGFAKDLDPVVDHARRDLVASMRFRKNGHDFADFVAQARTRGFVGGLDTKEGIETYLSLGVMNRLLHPQIIGDDQPSLAKIRKLELCTPFLNEAQLDLLAKRLDYIGSDHLDIANQLTKELLPELRTISANDIDRRYVEEIEKLRETFLKHGSIEGARDLESSMSVNTYSRDSLLIADSISSGFDVLTKYEAHSDSQRRASFRANVLDYVREGLFVEDLCANGNPPTLQELQDSPIWPYVKEASMENEIVEEMRAMRVDQLVDDLVSETSEGHEGVDEGVANKVSSVVDKFLEPETLAKCFIEYPRQMERFSEIAEKIGRGEFDSRKGFDALRTIVSGLSGDSHLKSLNATIGDAFVAPIAMMSSGESVRVMPEVYRHISAELADYQARRVAAVAKFETDFNKFVTTHHKNNEGQEAIIYIVDDQDLIADIDSLSGSESSGMDRAAVRVLKIYNPNKAYSEFEIQQEAHEILNEANRNGSSALVPRTLVHTELDIEDAGTIAVLKREGIDLSAGKVGVVVMEAIPGKDLQEVLLIKALEEHNKTALTIEEASNLEQSGDYVSASRVRVDVIPEDASLLYQTAGKVFDFVTARNPENANDRFQELSTNIGKVAFFLYERGVRIHPQIISQLKNGIQALNNGGIYHNDLHSRNVMVTGDIFNQSPDSGAQSYIIDFGFSGSKPTSGNRNSDLSIVEQIKRLSR